MLCDLVKKHIDFWLQIGYNVVTINFGKEVLIMKLRKIFAGMSALAIAATMSISAAAETGDTFLMVADNGWAYSNMNKDPDFALPEGGTTVKVTEDGTYTVDVTLDGMVAWMNKVAKAENPDAKEVVVDQKGYGFEYAVAMPYNQDGTIDYVKLGEAYGCKAERVFTPDELNAALKRAKAESEANGKCYLIDAICIPTQLCDMGNSIDAIKSWAPEEGMVN